FGWLTSRLPRLPGMPFMTESRIIAMQRMVIVMIVILVVSKTQHAGIYPTILMLRKMCIAQLRISSLGIFLGIRIVHIGHVLEPNGHPIIGPRGCEEIIYPKCRWQESAALFEVP